MSPPNFDESRIDPATHQVDNPVSMGEFRLESIERLARQIRFTPLARRLEQLAAGESLLLQIRPDQTYTIDQITLALTGYTPQHPDAPRPTLLAGIALQHDLGLLVEQISQSLQLHINSSSVPILTIEQVAQRLNVTSKTVHRWRRRGLPAGWFTFNDSRRRIGFRLTSVQQFLRSYNERSDSSDFCSTPALDCPHPARTLAWLLLQAQGLSAKGYWEQLAARRLSRPAGLSPLAIIQLLREHGSSISFAPDPSTDICRQVLERGLDSIPLRTIAAKTHLPLFGVYYILLDRRFHRAMRKPIRFIDDPLYHQPGALQTIETIIAQEPIEASCPSCPPSPEASRLPRDLPPYLRDLYRIPLLRPTQERGLFLKYHYHRLLASQEQRSLDPQIASARQLRKLDRLARSARLVRARLVEANLRLVVSVARKHVRSGVTLMELVSEGNLVLMRAVESFDIHRGYRFSTYGVYALMRGFARCIPAMLNHVDLLADSERMAEIFDPASDHATTQTDTRDHISALMTHLEERERDVLASRFGLSSGSQPSQTSQELGNRLNLSRQRITQIEQQAIGKLRRFANPA